MKPTQRFNHVALTVPAGDLDAEGRAALLRFYGEVFGWDEMPTLTVDRERLVLRAHANDQFVFIQASAKPTSCDGAEHFGLAVDSPEELAGIHERATRFGATDAAVELTPSTVEDFTAVKLHSFYVRYRLPFQVEVQCFEWAAGAGPGS